MILDILFLALVTVTRAVASAIESAWLAHELRRACADVVRTQQTRRAIDEYLEELLEGKGEQ